MAKELTEKQQAFIDALFSPECKGDPVKAKKAAGYSDNYPTRELVKSLKEEIMEAANDHFAHLAPRALMSLGNVLESPALLGTKEIIAAAKDILDRAGLVKTEKVDVNLGGGVLILPPKQSDEEEE